MLVCISAVPAAAQDCTLGYPYPPCSAVTATAAARASITPTAYPTVDLTNASAPLVTLTYRPTSVATNIFGEMNNIAPTLVEMYAIAAENGVQRYGEFERANESANWIWMLLMWVITLGIMRQIFRALRKATPTGMNDGVGPGEITVQVSSDRGNYRSGR